MHGQDKRADLYLDTGRAKPRILTNLTIPQDLMEQKAPLDKLYTLEIKTPGSDRVLKAAVPLCQLQASRFQEHFVFHVDSQGQIWHVDYTVTSSDCKPGILKPKSKKFKTTIVTSLALPGARPYLEFLPEPTPDGKPPPEQQSFLVKYWYYIVPLVIVMLMPAGEEPPKRGAGPAGAQRR